MNPTHRILFVEDHPDVREALASLLEESGWEVVPVGDAETGMERLSSGGIDMLVTDHSLPGKDGGWLAQQAVERGLLKPSRILVVTALPTLPNCDGLKVMHKPLDVSAFLDEVAQRLAPLSQAAVPPPRGAEPVKDDQRVRLALYMSSASAPSFKALRSLQGALEHIDPSEFHLDVCDLAVGSHEAAERDKVSYTPTLVKRGPGARSWVVGDLQDTEKLLMVLASWGLNAKPPHGAS